MRFGGYSDGYSLIRLKNVSNLITKGTTPHEFTITGIKFIKIDSLDGNIINNNRVNYISEKTHNNELKRSILQENDILLAIAGATVGKHCIVKINNLPANTNQALAIIRLNKELLPQYLLTLFDTELIPKYIKTVCAMSAQPNLNLEQVGNLEIYIPSIREQQKIVKFFSFIDDRIQTQNKIISQYNSLIKAISCQLFSNNSKTFKLGEIASIYQPQTISQTDCSNNGKYPVYGANGIIGHYYKYNHEKEQIIITCRGSTCGTVNMSDCYSWITGNAMVVNVDKKEKIVNKKYLFYYLKTLSFRSIISGSGQPQIVREPLQNYLIKLPDLETQNNIVAILNSFEIKLNIEEKLLQKYREQKSYLLSNMFI